MIIFDIHSRVLADKRGFISHFGSLRPRGYTIPYFPSITQGILSTKGESAMPNYRTLFMRSV
jgi:hypothetical protein